MKFCHECGEELKDTAKYCDNCGFNLGRETGQHRSGFLTASGVLVFISAGILILFGIIFIGLGIVEDEVDALIGGIFALIGAGMGIPAGILILKRRLLAFSILGITFSIIGGFFLGFATVEDTIWGFIVFGFPVVVLSALALIFTSIKCKDFTS